MSMKFDPEYGHLLKFWLAHDSWHVWEALAIITCIAPNSEGLNHSNKSIEPAFSDWLDFDPSA